MKRKKLTSIVWACLTCALLAPWPAGAQDPPPVQNTPTEIVPLRQMYAITTQDPGQLLIDGQGYKYISGDTAQSICRQFDGESASLDQMELAYEAGAELCHCGILETGGGAFPMQTRIEGCADQGVTGCGNGWKRNLAYCWGARPTSAEVTSANNDYKLQPFSSRSWSQYCESESDSDCQPEVERPTGPTFPAGPVPANMYTQLPDEELAWWAGDGSSVQSAPRDALLLPDSSVTSIRREGLPGALPTPAGYSGDGSSSPVLLARGRFVSRDGDQLVGMTKTGYQATDACRTVTYKVEGWLDPAVGQADFPTSTFSTCLAARDKWWRSPYALAAGDLDRALDDEGEFHDELVVAYENGNASVSPPGSLSVAVFDYSAGGGQVAQTRFTFPVGVPFNRLVYPNGEPGLLDVATFAADGTGARKIAVVHSAPGNLYGQSTGGAYGIDILGYRPASDGRPAAIEHLAAYSVSLVEASSAGISLASGDFNGDGLGEVAFLRPFQDSLSTTNKKGWKVMFFSYAEDTDGTGRVVILGDHPVSDRFTTNPGSAHVVAGTFHFAPDHGYDLGRQQIAVGLLDGSQLQVETFLVDGSFELDQQSSYATSISGHQFGMTAGGFAGVEADPANPIQGIALGYVQAGSSYVDFLAGSGLQRTARSSVAAQAATLTSVLAYDDDGDSLVLGAPVSFVADAPTQIFAILSQPPQHLDYLPNADREDGSGFLNVSRNPSFALVFSEEADSTMDLRQASTNSFSFGASTAASASASVTEKIPLLEKGTLAGGVDGKMSYAFDNSATSSVGTQDHFTYAMSEDPANEDALFATVQWYQIWRYRIYGAKTTDPENSNGFFEVYTPEGVTSASWYGASAIDAYQPIHENGNVLSYPDIYEDDPQSPSDLGVWKPTKMPPDCSSPPPPDFDGYKALLTGESQVFNLSGTVTTLEVKLDQTETCGNERSSSNTLAAGLDAKIQSSLQVNEIFAKEKVQAELGVSIGDSSSWSGLSAMRGVSKSSDELELQTVKLGDLGWNYSFMPVAYVTQNGTTKFDFYATLPGTQQNRWKTNYAKADPALNLPNKYVSGFEDKDWTFNTALDAQKIRGFFLRDGSQADPLGPVLGSVPQQGDKVQVEVWVYNYSALTPFSNLPVRFDLARYDDLTDSVSDRQVLGTVTAQYTDEASNRGGPSQGTTFNPRRVGRAVYTIDTGELDLEPGINDFAVFVVLNPEGDAPEQETHTWRSPNVSVSVYSKGRENVGAQLTLSFQDQDGTPIDAVTITSVGDPAADIPAFAEALNASSLATTFGFQAFPFPEQTPQTQPQKLVLVIPGSDVLPSPTSFTATLELPSEIDGVTALRVLPSVTGQGEATMAASNLFPGQNNEGYGLMSVSVPVTTGQKLAVAEDGLAVVDDSGLLVTGSAQVSVGDRVPARLCVSAPEGDYLNVVDIPIFLGEPAEGQGVAIKRLNGVDDTGSCTWFTWVPKAAGQEHLTAVLPTGESDALSVSVSP